MIRKRGKIQRGLIVLGSAAGSIGDLARGHVAQRCLQALAPAAGGLSLRDRAAARLAASVEALAPFIYSIF